jgi:PTH1 family peptidyl-tRNA hydrolase
MWLIVGLGNPGKEYEGSRHNAGFMVVDRIAERTRAPKFASKFKGEVAQTQLAGQPSLLLKPSTYMNLSGQSVQPAMSFYKIQLDHVIVIHDDMDLELGQIKIKVGGGAGGHNGLRSIDGQVGPNYIRVRAGVGHPGTREKVVGHVLTGFKGKDAEEAKLLVERCADAVEIVMKDGLTTAQNRFHTREKK